MLQQRYPTKSGIVGCVSSLGSEIIGDDTQRYVSSRFTGWSINSLDPQAPLWELWKPVEHHFWKWKNEGTGRNSVVKLYYGMYQELFHL